MAKTKVKGFICVTLQDGTEQHINVDSIESYEDFQISIRTDFFDVKEDAEQISQLINEALEFLEIK
jgi:hypothetical protein